MLAVTISAKSLSAFGASKATALAGKLTFGATAWGMRSTVGAGSQAASQFFRRTKFGATKYGRVASMALDKGAKASFDVRGATAFGGLKGMGVDAGDAQKGGYREKQKKTIEGHKEYAKSLTEAIGDRGPTRKEKNSSIEAGANHQAAEDRHTEAEHENVSATQQRDAHKAEVDRLAEELRRDRYLEHDPNHIRQRDAAAQNLAASETNLAAAAAKLAQAAADLEKAKNAKTDADTATMINIKTEKTDAQKRYAGSIDQSPIAWGMYGSGGSKAAKNIRAEANKSEDQKLLDALKKALNPTPPTTPPAGGPVTPPPATGGKP